MGEESKQSKIKQFFFGWIKDNYDRAFLIMILISIGMGLWAFFATKGQPLWYDSANFLSTAKRLALGLDNVNDIWYYRRGFFWVLFSALFFKTGIGEIGIQFSGVLFYVGLIIVSYFLIKNMFDKKIALFVSILMAFSWVLLFFIGRSMTEIPASFLLLLSLLFFWKGYVLKQGNKFLYLFGLFFGLAALTRFQYMMFLFPIFLYILFDKKFSFIKDKHLWITLGILLLTLVPHFIIYSFHYGFFITDILTYYIGVGASTASAASTKTFFNLFDYFIDFPYLLTPILLIPLLIGTFYFFSNLILGIDKITKDEEIRKRFFVFLWIVIPLIVLGKITEYVEQRYVTSVLPFLFLLIAVFFVNIEVILEKYLKLKKVTALIFVILILIGTIIPGVMFANSLIENKKSSYLEVQQSAIWIKEHSNIGDIIISNSVPYFTYYAERSCYPFSIQNWGKYIKNLQLANYSEGEKGLDEFIQDYSPRYMTVSGFENHEQWIYSYAEHHPEILTPVKVFYNNNQPIIIIYEFDYQ